MVLYAKNHVIFVGGWVDNAVSFMFILNENIESKTSYTKGECY